MRLFIKTVLPLALILTVAMTVSMKTADAADVSTMAKDQLKDRLSDGNLVVLDVRTGRDWSGSEFKIQGAKRADPNNIQSWAGAYAKDQVIVLYCA